MGKKFIYSLLILFIIFIELHIHIFRTLKLILKNMILDYFAYVRATPG